MSRPSHRRATVAVHAPLEMPPVGGVGERPNIPPLYQTAGWESADLAGNEAMAEGGGYFYARYGSPNVDAAAACIARLEGAQEAVCFASGMAAGASATPAFHFSRHSATFSGFPQDL